MSARAGPREREPWYRDGLRFGCARCGRCCTGAGLVRVTDAEVAALAARLELAESALRTLYTRERRGELCLRDKRNRDCVFYARDLGCTVYEDRPRQCRSWPFWRAVVHSAERWEEEAEACPGMNRGPLFDAEAIEALLADDGTSGFLPGGEGVGRESGADRERTAWDPLGSRSER